MPLAALPPLITATLYLFVGIFVLWNAKGRAKSVLGYSLWLFTTVYWQLGWAIVFSLDGPRWASLLIRLNYTGIVFIPIAFYHLISTVTNARREQPWLWLSYAIGILFATLSWRGHWLLDGYYTRPWGYYAKAGTLHPLFLVFLVILVTRGFFLLYRKEVSLENAEQLKLFRLAFVLYLPASVDFAINYGLPCYPIGFLFTLISLMVISYAIIRHQLFDVQVIIRKALLYTLITLIASVSYVFLLVGILQFLKTWGGAHGFFSSAAWSALAMSILFFPIQAWVNRQVNAWFPEEAVGRQLLREAAGGFVHEIKRPLANISLPAELALKDIAEPSSKFGSEPLLSSLKDRLAYILGQTHVAAERIEALRLLSTEELSEGEPIDLSEVLRRATRAEALNLQGAALSFITSSEPILAVGNSQQFEIAFLNILRNAVDALRTIPTTERWIRCELKTSGSTVEITIADSGKGIQAKNLAQVFKPWHSTKGPEGMGLGLYIAREIIRRFRGSVKVVNAKTGGAVFTIFLPLAR